MWEWFGYQTEWGFGDLGSTTFSNDGIDYIVELVWRVKITDLADNGVLYETLSIGVFPALPDGTVFQVGARTFTVGADSVTTTIGIEQWDIQPDPTPSWTKDHQVTVSLKLPANDEAAGVPTISGTAQVGQTLTASTSGISDSDGLTNVTYSYQWLADDTEIDGATSSTYTLQASDNGRTPPA